MDAETKTDVDQPKAPNEELSVEYYKEICSSIRFSDDISFKLLQIVPVLSGIGSTILVILEKSQLLTSYSSSVVLCLSISGVLITSGLFIWELRNISKCNWYIERAGDFERRFLKIKPKKSQTLQFADFNPSKVRKNKSSIKPWGKTEAEKLIYWVAIGLWLIPIFIVILRESETIGNKLLKKIPQL